MKLPRTDGLPVVPEPTVILLGCQPNLRPRLDGRCPVCGGSIRPDHLRHYCAQCDRMAPANETKTTAGRLGLKARDAAATAAARLQGELQKTTRRAVLSELNRRRMWNGYKGVVGYSLAEAALGPIALHYRKFLVAIDQCPDWSLVLDRQGRTIGRRVEPATPEEPVL